MMKIRQALMGLSIALGLVSSAIGAELYPGLQYEKREVAATEPARAHIVAIDLRQAGLHFGVTFADTSKGMEQVAWTTSTYMKKRHAQLAINGGFFSPWKPGGTGQDDYYPHEGDPVRASGALISAGQVVSPVESIKPERINAMLCFDRANVAIVDGQKCPKGFIDGVAAGPRLLNKGKTPPLTGDFSTTLHPRTAFGVSADRKRAWIVTIDGRQANSKGMSLPDLAALFASLGASDAINLDGGGSTTLVVEGDNGKPKVLNSPIQTGVVGKERPVANHVLLFVPHEHAGPATASRDKEPELVWHAAGNNDWAPEGRAWGDEARLRYFDRFPAAAESSVPEKVWNLSRQTAGMMFRFKTDAATIWVDYELMDGEKISMPHMPATGVSGVDLYARDEQEGGKWKWVGVTKPSASRVRAALIDGLRPGMREYAAYLPLYNGVEKISFGVNRDATFQALAPRPIKPIVFYGTSITQGASASRPGMVHAAILGRRLDRPVINLGFSGNGKMDESVGALIGRVDAAAIVIDCAPNMNAELLRERTVPLVKQIRAAHRDTPIVLVEDRRFTNSWITPAKRAYHDANHAALKEAYSSLQREGVERLYFISGDELYGADTEGATDASHASDLGFMRQADVFEPVLRKALEHATAKEKS